MVSVTSDNIRGSLWGKKDFSWFGSDAERGLNFLLNELERISLDPLELNELRVLYASPYADMPVRIGNKEHGMVWRNPVGIPAGFTKDGRGSMTLIRGMRIGSLELGTTPFLDQPGNPEPRFFMYYDAATGVFSTTNRFGFNSQGIVPLAYHLWDIRHERDGDAVRTPIIVSIGPN